MRQRLVLVYLSLVVAVCLGLTVPLCVAIADRATVAMALDRSADATRFAALAEQAVVSGQPGAVPAELVAYRELYGIDAIVVDREGGVVATGRPGLTLAGLGPAEWQETAGLPEPVLAALAGTRGGTEQTLWPWSQRPLLVTEPIGSGGEVVGVVVTSSPTGDLRRGVTAQWLAVLAGVWLAVAAGSAAAGRLSRWVLRPVADLEDATRAVGLGSMRPQLDEIRGPDELRHLTRAFNEMVVRLNSVLTKQRAFVAYAGHQIRNPLAALRLRVESLAATLTDEQDRAAQQIALDELDRLSRTCDALITLARGEDERLDRVEIDLDEVVLDRIRAWTPIADRSRASLIPELTEGLRVRAVDGTLEQALDALVDNALTFGGTGVQVVLGTSPTPEGGVQVEVRDDGPGLPESLLQQQPRPFWQVDGAEAGGSGLGLGVVVTLLELDGGTLTLSPAEPHGLSAVITLPAGARP